MCSGLQTFLQVFYFILIACFDGKYDDDVKQVLNLKSEYFTI